jgi:hypothetical protein
MKGTLRGLFSLHHPDSTFLKAMALMAIFSTTWFLRANDSVIVGSVRIEMLSGTVVRLESEGAEVFEDRTTFHVVNRNWPGTSYTRNLISGQVVRARNQVENVN